MTTETGFEERRRAPRHDIKEGVALLPSLVNVQVREVSLLGMLLDSPEPIEVGAMVSLRTTISGEPFTAQVEVRRVTHARLGASPGFRIGVKFLTLTAEHRRVIERYVRR
jgi:hypothetical protein